MTQDNENTPPTVLVVECVAKHRAVPGTGKLPREITCSALKSVVVVVEGRGGDNISCVSNKQSICRSPPRTRQSDSSVDGTLVTH